MGYKKKNMKKVKNNKYNLKRLIGIYTYKSKNVNGD